MNPILNKILQGLFTTEANFLPLFIHDPKSQTIAGAILATEATFASLFGFSPTPQPAAPTSPTQNPPSE